MKHLIFSISALPLVLAAALTSIPAAQAGGGGSCHAGQDYGAATISRRPNDQSRLTCESTWVSATSSAVLARLKSGLSFQLETTGGTATALNDQVEMHWPQVVNLSARLDCTFTKLSHSH